jgi:hypothetical protein
VKLKKTATETLNSLRGAHGESTATDDERLGRSVTTKTDENVEKVRTVVGTDLNMTKCKMCTKTVPKNPPVYNQKTNTKRNVVWRHNVI